MNWRSAPWGLNDKHVDGDNLKYMGIYDNSVDIVRINTQLSPIV